MTAKITIDQWAPLPGSLPDIVAPDTVYVLPTQAPRDSYGPQIPLYTDNVRYFPKEARIAGAPVEFATSEGTRKYVQHFSVDPEVWALGLVLLTTTSDWLIFTVQQFIALRSRSQGWSEEEAKELPLKLSIVETSTSRNLQVEGSGADVLEALRIFRRDELRERRD